MLPVPDFNPQAACDPINRQKPYIMWRELIFDSGISETNDQFHATIPISMWAAAF